jgi:D-alanyl-D-alanine carboxypeptidase
MSKLPRVIRLVAVTTVLATSIAALPTSASSAPPGSAAQRSLDAVSAAGAVGAFAEIRADGRTWSGATGIADLSNAKRMQPKMRQRIGSITKTFVATTLLQLVSEGRLGLDDPVGRWLPDLVPGELGQRITVRMLLNHTSGIGNYTDALLTSYESFDEIRVTTYSPEQLLAIGLGLPRTGEPGARWSYSNTGYIAAGLILQRVTGRNPADEIARRIIRPLRLTDTYFPGAETVVRGPHPGAYFAAFGTRNWVDTSMTWAWMAGEMVSTTADLNTFFKALLGGRLLAPAMLAQMRTTVPFDPENPDVAGYGLGLYWQRLSCGQVWGHDGGVIGQITVSWHLPDASRQFSFAMNFSHYQFIPAAHPIDVAMVDFADATLCPASSARAGAAPAAPRLPGQLKVAAAR